VIAWATPEEIGTADATKDEVSARLTIGGGLRPAPLLQFLLEHWEWRVGVALFIVLALVMVPAAHLTVRRTVCRSRWKGVQVWVRW
jgi:hypothetical protein